MKKLLPRHFDPQIITDNNFFGLTQILAALRNL